MSFIVGAGIVVIDSSANIIVGSGTTAQRPVTGSPGQLWFNTDTNALQGWTTTWIDLCK